VNPLNAARASLLRTVSTHLNPAFDAEEPADTAGSGALVFGGLVIVVLTLYVLVAAALPFSL